MFARKLCRLGYGVLPILLLLPVMAGTVQEPALSGLSSSYDTAKQPAADKLSEVRSILQQATQAASNIESAEPRMQALLRIANVQLRARDHEAAAKTLHQAFQAALAIEDIPSRVGNLLRIGKAQAKAKDRQAITRALHQAAQSLNAVENPLVKVSQLVQIAEAQAEAGDKRAAVETCQKAFELVNAIEIKTQGDLTDEVLISKTRKEIANKKSMLDRIFHAQAKVGDAAGAMRTLAALEASYNQPRQPGLSQRYRYLAAVAQGQAYAGNIKEALQIAATIDHEGARSTTLRAIVKTQARLGDFKGAATTAQLAVQYVLTMQNDAVKSSWLGVFAAELAGLGDQEAAEKTFHTALETFQAVQPDTTRIYLLLYVAEAHLEVGNLQAAREAYRMALQSAKPAPSDELDKETTTRRVRDSATMDMWLGSLAEGLAKVGDVRAALEAAAMIEKASKRTLALLKIAELQEKSGDLDGTASTLVKARQGAADMSHPGERAQRLASIAELHAMLGDQAASEKTFQQALEAAGSVGPVYPEEDIAARVFSLESIATAKARTGDAEGALEVTATIEELASTTPAVFSHMHTRVRVHRLIGEYQATKGDEEAAAKAFREAHRATSRVPTESRASQLYYIAAAQARAGDVNGALAWATGESSPPAKAYALIGVAEGMLDGLDARKNEF